MIYSKTAASTVYFSRRRARQQERLPDWVWGAGLGVLVLIFVGAFFVVRSVGGGGGSTCDNPLANIGPAQVNAESFVDAEASMTRVVGALEAGDRAGAESFFYGDTHNFTHAVDPELRDVDEQAAKDLCQAVLDIEESMISGSNAAALNDARRVREALRDAAEILGFPRPG
jgi:hypothetical protein